QFGNKKVFVSLISYDFRYSITRSVFKIFIVSKLLIGRVLKEYFKAAKATPKDSLAFLIFLQRSQTRLVSTPPIISHFF
ncbi:hypothetical protein IJJ05_02445, partial [Candidatus Saccharibacteria bacterium]|nr:hypothetical protein [Candidatus Saccharibacteria bacterium]